MYVPPAFRDTELASLHGAIRAARLANVITATAEGLLATPLPQAGAHLTPPGWNAGTAVMSGV